MDPISAYADFTQAIVDVTGMTRPMLHMHAGMAIYLLAQVLLGTRRGSILALAAVLEIELLNELMNRLHYGTWRWDDTRQDIMLTLLWPTACYAVSSYRRWRWRARQNKAGAHATHTAAIPSLARAEKSRNL